MLGSRRHLTPVFKLWASRIGCRGAVNTDDRPVAHGRSVFFNFALDVAKGADLLASFFNGVKPGMVNITHASLISAIGEYAPISY